MCLLGYQAGADLIDGRKAERVGGVFAAVQLPQEALGPHVAPGLPSKGGEHQPPLVACRHAAVP